LAKVVRAAAVVAAAVALLANASHSAFAGPPPSAGCAAVNAGGFNQTLPHNNSVDYLIINFAVGDTITLHATFVGAGAFVEVSSGAATLIPPFSTSGTRVHTVTSADLGRLKMQIGFA
jgi:hypothetical protein